MGDNYDITIIGSGLASYTALLYLIENKIHLKKNICVIAGENTFKYNELDNKTSNYLRRFHKVIFERKNFGEIDKGFLNFAMQSKSNLIYLRTIGGLSKYWGAGFFPNENYYNNSKIKSFIKKYFKISKLNKNNYFNINSLNLKFIKTLNSKFLISNDNDEELLNPGLEIEKLCKLHKLIFLRKCSVQKISFEDSLNFNIFLGNNFIKTTYLLMGAGVIGTPKILYESGIISSKELIIKDHLLYRIPLIRPLKLFKSLIKFNNYKFNNEKSISSLKQSFLLNIIRRNIFLGLYSLDPKKIKFKGLLKYLVENEVIIFSQIYVGDGLGEFKSKISLNFESFKEDYLKFKSLSFKEWRIIILFFLTNKLLPIPYNYRTRFGSSYHYFGTLPKQIVKDLMLPSNLRNNLHIVDGSSLDRIDAEPTSFRVINHTIEKVSNFLKILENN